ncbi:hypothetical protein PYCC9005_004169 [Savitreella phatthalungensis]
MSDKVPKSQGGISNTPRDTQTMPHVNEEAVAYDNVIKGVKSPTEEEEGISVGELLKDDPSAPKVIKEGLKSNPKSGSTGASTRREFSTSSRVLSALEPVTERLTASQIQLPYNLPDSDPVLKHLIGLTMKHGKKAQATRRVQDTLNILQRNGVGSVPFTDPVHALKDAIDQCSPLVKLIQRKVGSKNVPVPIPLNEKGRRRKAITWILESADKRSDKRFPVRFAQEISAVLDGTSQVFQKKEAVHKMALLNRANAQVKA